MKIFISYGGPADQVTALRLQALASVNGLTVYVPPAHTRMGRAIFADAESGKHLREAEVVLGVVGFGLTEACREELNLGIGLGKQMIVMAYPMFAPQLQTYLGATNVVLVDPSQPGETEYRIVSHLKNMDAQKSTNTALVALGTLALGLLLFAATSERA